MTTPAATTPTPPPRDPIAPRVKGSSRTAAKTDHSVITKRNATTVPPLPADAKTRDEMRDKVAQWYARFGGIAVKTGRVALGNALKEQSAGCADAWMKVAEKNARVRRFVFAVNEGNAWLDLIIAHAPVLLATLPESALDKLMNQFMGALFSASAGADAELSTDETRRDSGKPN